MRLGVGRDCKTVDLQRLGVHGTKTSMEERLKTTHRHAEKFLRLRPVAVGMSTSFPPYGFQWST